LFLPYLLPSLPLSRAGSDPESPFPLPLFFFPPPLVKRRAAAASAALALENKSLLLFPPLRRVAAACVFYSSSSFFSRRKERERLRVFLRKALGRQGFSFSFPLPLLAGRSFLNFVLFFPLPEKRELGCSPGWESEKLASLFSLSLSGLWSPPSPFFR